MSLHMVRIQYIARSSSQVAFPTLFPLFISLQEWLVTHTILCPFYDGSLPFALYNKFLQVQTKRAHDCTIACNSENIAKCDRGKWLQDVRQLSPHVGAGNWSPRLEGKSALSMTIKCTFSSDQAIRLLSIYPGETVILRHDIVWGRKCLLQQRLW